MVFLIQVNIDNLEEYISLVVAATVKTGITRQMEAFRAGFNQVIISYSFSFFRYFSSFFCNFLLMFTFSNSQVFDISALQIFSPIELDYMLCGHRELWEVQILSLRFRFLSECYMKYCIVLTFYTTAG